MAALLPPSSVHGTFWFAFACFAIAAVFVYSMAEYVQRKYRLFHWAMALMNGISALSYCVMASTYLGFVLVDERPFFLVRYLDLSVTVPLMMLTIGLLSGTRLVETLFLAALTSLVFLTQIFCGLHPEGNRWWFYALNFMFYVPIASALSGGFRSQAEMKFGPIPAGRVTQLSLAVLLYTLVLQLLLLLTEGMHYVHHEPDIIAATLADVIVKMAFTITVVYSGDVTARAVDSDDVLSVVTGAWEGGEGMGGEETMETGIAGLKMRGGDPMHMKPEATERSSLRGKV